MNATATKAGRWTAADVPDQTGRVAVITGANTGIGFEAAKVLAARGATVVLACRNPDRAGDALTRLTASAPGARVEFLRLDLSSLASIREAAAELRGRHAEIDLLVNNAGVMWTPRSTTADGFELQFGTNHLGHFAFTGLVLDRLLPVVGSRVVTISSMGHRTGQLDFDDLQSERSYGRHRAYAASKLANLMFTYELQHRLETAAAHTAALAAHPGGAGTELMRNSPPLIRFLNPVFGPLVTQSAERGALPTLRAATDPFARGAEYYGPDGLGEVKGFPKRVGSTARSHDKLAQRRLWQESLQLTGVTFPV
ncbi:SDR family NAD(P)-dependent oxidoreductase [Catellatospora citrea]|uniref:Short-chain dehydrogenase n=1 Tax=Catellatospora citrea TaxID=53366 RepID=A0A8J3KCS7_9ACTN|nr:SDR family NAD(P)-dependent oxidoreductase [Catellatospora citrea]RKE12315.1 NAD(P)-dependent dehydrogenase (short-subunit alcohol dehydrogenase family) [Catellatospora citrea]GIG00822.1 short-chain dehydrogenase [Catellatospora citrea]